MIPLPQNTSAKALRTFALSYKVENRENIRKLFSRIKGFLYLYG